MSGNLAWESQMFWAKTERDYEAQLLLFLYKEFHLNRLVLSIPFNFLKNLHKIQLIPII
jgi:hypothetical protein